MTKKLKVPNKTKTKVVKPTYANLDKISQKLLRHLLEMTTDPMKDLGQVREWVDHNYTNIIYKIGKEYKGGYRVIVRFSQIDLAYICDSYLALLVNNKIASGIINTTEPLLILGLSLGYFEFKTTHKNFYTLRLNFAPKPVTLPT